MMITLGGAMSTAELGISLAEMIRQDKVQIITCTGANLEEDIMNLVAHSHYKRVPHYRDLTPQDEWELLENHMNRVTDTCIPEEEAFRRLQQHIFKIWKDADDKGERYLPYEFMYKLLRSGELEQYYEIDPKNSWMLAACEKEHPDHRSGLGRQHDGQHLHVVRHQRRTESLDRQGRHRNDDLPDRMVPRQQRRQRRRILPDRRRHFGRLPDLRGADDVPGSRMGRRAVLGLLLPDFGLDDFVRIIFGRRSERKKDHLGQTRSGHPEIHRRVGRHDRRSADFSHTCWAGNSARNRFHKAAGTCRQYTEAWRHCKYGLQALSSYIPLCSIIRYQSSSPDNNQRSASLPV